jgi:hypothetical protein
LISPQKKTITEEEKMSETTQEDRDKIALKIGWTPRRVLGYEDGRFYQRSGQDIPWCLEVEMDEYSKGFRTGYYAHTCLLSTSNIRETRRGREKSADIIRLKGG